MVAAGLPHFALSAFAAAASEKHAEIKASLQPPLERDGVLAVARACLVLLEAVIPKLARLAHFADTLSGLSQRAGASGADSAELRAAIEEARLALHRADETGVDIGRPRCRRRRRSSGSAPTPVRRRKRRSSGPAPAPPTTASVIKALVEAVRLNEPATQSAQAQSGRLFSRAAEGAFEPAEEGGGGEDCGMLSEDPGPGSPNHGRRFKRVRRRGITQMTEIRRRKQSKEVAGQCNRTEETLIQSNETGLTGETLDQNSPTEESSIQRDQAGEAVKRRRMTPLFSPITGEVRDEESEGGDGWDWAMDFDPSRTDVGGVEASFCGILGMSDSEGCALGGSSESSWAPGWASGTCSGQGCRSGGGACRRGCCSGESAASHGETLSSEVRGGSASPAVQQPEGEFGAAGSEGGGPGGCGSGEQSAAGGSPSSEMGPGGAAAVQQPVGGVGTAGSDCGGPAQRLPLDNYAYCHSLSLDLALRDFEAELDYCTKRYAQVVQEQALKCGWLNPLEYSFMGKGTMAWRDKRSDNRSGKRAGSSGGQEDAHGIVVPVPLPLALPRKRVSSDSGKISASALRYRRLRTAFIRGLYLQLIVRNHWTEETGDGAADAKAKAAGEKRKRGSEVGSADDNTSQPGPDSEAGATKEKGGGGTTGVKEGREQTKEQMRREAAVSAFVKDLPHPLLKLLLRDAKVRGMAIGSEHKMRKKLLLEIKAEARRTRQDPMQVLEAAVKTASTSGSMRHYCVLGSFLNRTCPSGSTLPTAENVAKGKRELMEMAVDDLKLQETQDGYRISLIRAVESEALRLMQTTRDLKRQEARVVGLDPDQIPHWQDYFDVKLTFDARRITKHCSQTEVMIIFLPKGQAGVDRCQQAVHIRTIAVWTGKDSRENVDRNLTDIVMEAAQLERKGIAFSRAADSFLGVAESGAYEAWLRGREKAYGELPSEGRPKLREWLKTEESGAPAPFRRVLFRFWVAADMLAQCSLIGQGCAGHHYCPHCDAHKENRHLPFELFKIKTPTNLWKLANDSDMMVETLWAINTCKDLGAKGRQPWDLTEEGLMACTLPCSDPALARAAKPPGPAQGAAAPPAPAVPAQPQAASICGGEMRQSKGPRARRRPAAAAAAGPVPVQAAAQGATPPPTAEFPTGPETAVIMRCDGWTLGHGADCPCRRCVIPAGTILRRLIQPGFSRESAYLDKCWNGVSRGRFPFCALHCNMRITEAMFYNICQNALAAGEPAVARLNSAMQMIGLKSKKFQKVRMFTCEHYERLSFLGHEALLLLKKNEESGKRNVQVLLEHLWPSGDASESREGRNFVERSIVLWDCWGEVVELMSERDPEKLRKSMNSKYGNGFARFGKVCREFCFRYQALFHKTHCKSFYLHTLLAHAGDFMRELEKYDMCLGMMSNSGAERRHEYGRRAFRRSLCGGCWAKHDPELANKKNMSAFLTLREILIWQYGSDLLSHEKARRAAASLEEDRRAADSAGGPDGPDSGADASQSLPGAPPQPLMRLTEANLEKHCSDTEAAERLRQFIEPLLSPTEEEAESRPVAPMHADPAESILGETAREGWELVRHDRSLALNTLPVPQGEADGLSGKCYSGSADRKETYEVGLDARLTNGICDVVSDVDGDGSEDVSSDGSCSDSSDSSSDGGGSGGGVRFRDLEFPDSDEGEEWEQSDTDADECDERVIVAAVDDASGGCAARHTARTPSWRQGGRGQTEADFELQYATQDEVSAGSPSAEPDASSGLTVGMVCGPSNGAGTGSRSSGSGGGARRGKPTGQGQAPTKKKTGAKKLTEEEKVARARQKKVEALKNQFRVSQGV